MSLESLYKLSILVNMIDRVSGPAAVIGSKVASTTNKFQAYSTAMADIARDGIVLMGTGYQIADAAIAPVKSTFATQDALAELSSLGVEKLGALENAASQFTSKWAGTSKAEFLTAAYDIKSGIASLSDEGVANYTDLAGVTAKATKATVGTMTDLFATGYGIYKDYYNSLSDLEFGEMFSAGIAQSVKQFKTTGSGMAQAISALGGTATSAKVPLEEQLSILGMLQATMSGSEAGTKYTAFLNQAAKAGGELGLKFTGANGQLKSMPEILGTIQGKFGDVLDAGEKMQLQKAFGTVEAVKLIDLLYSKTDDLQGNIVTLYDTMGRGMSVTEGMANKINAPPGQSWDLLKQKLQATAETVGNAMLPRFMELQEKVDGAANKIADFANKHPQLTSNIMYTVMAFGTFLMALGAAKLAIGGLGAFILSAKKIVQGYRLVLNGLRYAVFLVQYGAFLAKPALAALGKGFLTGAGAALKFTAALLTNPITWIVIGIIALIAAIILLYKNWDTVSAFLQSTWNKVVGGVTGAIDWLREKLASVPDGFLVILAAVAPFIGIPLLIIKHWDTVSTFFRNLPENIKSFFTALPGWFSSFFTGLGNQFRESGRKVISTFVEGLKSMATAPFDTVANVFQKVRQLLPFSDAKEGPFSDLTLSGRRVFETLDTGMQQTADLPADTIGSAFEDADGGIGASGSAGGTGTTGSGRQTIIQELILNIKLDDIDTLQKLKKLIQEIEDDVNGDDPDPEAVPVF